MFLPRRTLSFVLLSLLAVVTAGCPPPVEKRLVPPGAALPEEVPLGTVPASTTTAVATPEEGADEEVAVEESVGKGSDAKERTTGQPAEEESRVDEHYEIVLVGNPLYNEKDPVLYDSGYEDTNDSCMVCHMDFEKELISATHLEAGVTCMACHGDSEVHRADEYNIMRPDVVWGRADMVNFCKQCHPKHRHPEKVEAFLQEWDSKRRPNGRWIEANAVCTECHGKHAITIGEEGTFK